MLNLSGFSHFGLIFAVLSAGSVISHTLVNRKQIPLPLNQDFWVVAKSVNISSLADGNVVFHSPPVKRD